jgi:hypothetical protein
VALASEPRLVQLREQLAAERAAGAAFTDAWERARGEVLSGLVAWEREAWSSVLITTRWAWRSAYYRSSSGPAWVTELEA